MSNASYALGWALGYKDLEFGCEPTPEQVRVATVRQRLAGQELDEESFSHGYLLGKCSNSSARQQLLAEGGWSLQIVGGVAREVWGGAR